MAGTWSLSGNVRRCTSKHLLRTFLDFSGDHRLGRQSQRAKRTCYEISRALCGCHFTRPTTRYTSCHRDNRKPYDSTVRISKRNSQCSQKTKHRLRVRIKLPAFTASLSRAIDRRIGFRHIFNAATRIWPRRECNSSPNTYGWPSQNNLD